MAKKQSARKRAKESARWEAGHTPKSSPARGYPCTRCSENLTSVADLSQHHHDAHLGGGR